MPRFHPRPTPLRYLVVLALLSAQLLSAQTPHSGRKTRKLWWVALAALAAASAADAHSSWGRPEKNALLRGPDGRFGARALGIKLGAVGAAGLAQWLALRHRPRWEGSLAALNFTLAAWTGGVGASNHLRTSSPRGDGARPCPPLQPAGPLPLLTQADDQAQ